MTWLRAMQQRPVVSRGVATERSYFCVTAGRAFAVPAGGREPAAAPRRAGGRDGPAGGRPRAMPLRAAPGAGSGPRRLQPRPAQRATGTTDFGCTPCGHLPRGGWSPRTNLTLRPIRPPSLPAPSHVVLTGHAPICLSSSSPRRSPIVNSGQSPWSLTGVIARATGGLIVFNEAHKYLADLSSATSSR
jgi:hypothetical protein